MCRCTGTRCISLRKSRVQRTVSDALLEPRGVADSLGLLLAARMEEVVTGTALLEHMLEELGVRRKRTEGQHYPRGDRRCEPHG